jgi:peptidoglycan/LPS O-acetylase OafA/YrhL
LVTRPEQIAVDNPPSATRSLDDFIDSRSGGFDVLRLVLAFLVLISHSWVLGGFGREPGSPFGTQILTLGGFAVGAFFALSGMLVGRSALRRTPARFARARAARVLPAYWAALALSALVAGMLGWLHEQHRWGGYIGLQAGGPLLYVVRNALLPIDFFHSSNGVFATSTPYGIASGGSWINGSLWTLPYEVRCYIVIALLAVVARKFGTRRTIGAAWLVTAAIAVGYHWHEAPVAFTIGFVADAKLITLLLIFLTGAMAGIWADRIRLFGIVPVIGLVVALVAGRRSLFFADNIAGAATAVLVAPAAALLAPFARFLRGVDISYGVYLYAWPIQQLVAMYDITSNPWMFVLVSGAITTGVAVASWFVIEQPAMRRWSR